MPRRTKPLELILRAHGPAELLNADGETLWASDADEDFKEEFNDEFLQEEDIGDILEYLVDSDILSDEESDHFADETWEFNIETLEDTVKDPDDDDSDGDDEDYDEG
jgi:hypothetical protein